MIDFQKEIDKLKKRLIREKKSKEALEKIIEDRSRDLFLSYEFSKKVLDSVDNLILTTDENLKIISNNESWGQSVQNLKGQYLYKVFKLVETENKLKDKILNDASYEGELSLQLDNKVIPVYVKGHRINTEKIINYVFSLVDLTRMKEIEKERTELQERLIKSAYADGVTESAIAVLHNIGNVLTALNSRISNKSEISELQKMSKIMDIFSQKQSELSKEKQKEILKVMQDSFDKSLDEMNDLYSFVSSKCSHIANIISSQQKYANLKENIRTKTNLLTIIDDCLEMISDRFKNRGIKVYIERDEIPKIMSEKIGLSQVVLNLFTNAMESIDEKVMLTKCKDEQSIQITFSQNQSFLTMSVHDTGMGVEPDKLKELFNFGYSTKNRSSGFGLHNCANYMKNNNGKITIKSQGRYKGATVELSFEIEETLKKVA
ncbi:MAG: HAMP domain-containing histidine kinase [Bacteriovoracaceae bacterium]|nr:HAMP domain-containing histidine kinase [Bacteriovoracaceae bacterium]